MKSGKIFLAFAFLFLLLSGTSSVLAQTTGSIAGTVRDSNGQVVPNATVTVKGEGGQEFTATTSGNGTYQIPAVQNGFYTVTVTANGFKKFVTENVKVDVGVPSTVDTALETGSIEETVVVTGGAEVIQTQTATVGNNIQGRQIIETPIQSRDALDLVVLQPGTNTTGTARTSTINGLPKGAISISIDGADVQDSLLRSSDGFFTYVRPRIDAIEEVTISTSNPGAESSGDGAVQIKFVTRRGTNDYTGGAFWQHRDESLNANYFFNNRDFVRIDGKAPRNKLRLNQFGGRFGGPIPFLNFGEGGDIFDSGKDKRFFFVNYEEYRLPEASPTRTRTLLNPTAQNGVFQYLVGSELRSVNLYQLATANGLPSTPDPTIAALLSSIRSSTSGGSLSAAPGDPNRDLLNFVNLNNQKRTFLAVRLDFNITKNHSLENVFNKQPFRSPIDFLNALDPSFPGFTNAGAQNSDRFSNSTALRSSFGQNIVNELRYGRLWGRSGFTLVGGTEFFDQTQRGFNLAIGAAGITNPTVRNAAQLRESPTNDLINNLTWIVGSHTLTFGGQFKKIGLIDDNRPQFVPTVNFGVLAQDPALSVFNTTNFPGASATQLTEAQNLYATLTGRVSSYTQTGYLGADGRYVASGPLFREVGQRTYGLFAQDTWRFRPNLTINLGLRWQPQEGFTLKSENFSRLEDFNQIYDVSGPGNLFSPGTLAGQVPRVIGTKQNEKAFDTDYNNFAPTIGVVWSPDFGENSFLRTIFGESGKSVFRGGFGRAFVREGTILAGNTLGLNPGGQINLNRTIALNNFTVGTLLRDTNNPNLTPANFSVTPAFPRTLTTADAALAFTPDLKTGYVDSYSFGLQRELDKNTVVEVRYVGNRGKDILRLYSLNETNTIENGLSNEFRLAQANLLANRAAGRGNTFAFFGAGTGTSPLPIILSYVRGVGDPNLPANYGALFSNLTLINTLATANPNVIGLAGTLQVNFRNNASAAGRPVNFLENCPTTLGACFVVDNSETSSYDSAVIEVRRRLSQGLRVQASYVFAKAFTNSFAGATTFATAAGADQNNNASVTLRNPDLDNSPAQIDLRHAFKLDASYDLPFGRGKQFFGNANWFTNALIGGFSFVPTLRWQSGSPFSLENVQLVGMTVDELQKEIRVRKDAIVSNRNVVTYLPDDIILNTKRAFDVNATSATGYGNNFGGAPTGRFIAPAGYGNCLNRSPGECGFRRLVLYGPSFFKWDLAVLKRIQFDEKRNIELRATFFDVLNQTNFRVGGWTANFVNVTGFGAGFGELGAGTAYQDPFGSNDPGGRVIDLTLRINF